MRVAQEDIDDVYENLINWYGDKETVLARYRAEVSMPDDIFVAINKTDNFKRDEIPELKNAIEAHIKKLSFDLPINLSEQQKEQVQRFYSTNAGALFINTWVRNAYIKKGQKIAEKYSGIEQALAAAAKESASQHSVIFSAAHRGEVLTAFRQGDPQKVMRAALSDGIKYTQAPQYRGTLVPKDVLDNFNVGDVMRNTFFTSFSPDIYTPQKRDEKDKLTHDGFKAAKKFTENGRKYHTGIPVIYEIPARQDYKAHVIKSIYEYETVIPPGEDFEIKEIDRKKTPVYITLQRVGKAKQATKYMIH